MTSSHARAFDIARRYFKSVGTPYSLNLLSKGVLELCQADKPDPLEYDNHSHFARDYACYTFLRKFEGAANAKVLETNAVKVFKETEKAVGLTNRNLKLGAYAQRRGVGSCIYAARQKVQDVLGRFIPSEWLNGCEWGPGATSSLKAADATLDNKILEPAISVTVRALPFYRWILEHDIHMFCARTGIMPEGAYSVLRTEFSIVDSSRLTTVEKSVIERRPIDIQPTANLFLQKGIGCMIRRRLKRFGVNLDDQSRNQMLASLAGRLGLATIDLAKASDTVSTELVRLLLPKDWFFALDALRTTHTSYQGEKMYLNKFSAMGNGYTFELESLIFYCLAVAVGEHIDIHDLVGIYGDDIIVERHVAKELITVLSSCGFETNLSKSFTSGRFYESCGRHFFDGKDVTPLYQKEEVTDFLSAIRCANRIIRHAWRIEGENLDAHSKPAWELAVKTASLRWYEVELLRVQRYKAHNRKVKPIRPIPTIPLVDVGDDALLSFEPRISVVNSLPTVKVFRLEPVGVEADEMALLSISLRRGCVTESPFDGLVTLRGRTKRARVTTRVITLKHSRLPSWTE